MSRSEAAPGYGRIHGRALSTPLGSLNGWDHLCGSGDDLQPDEPACGGNGAVAVADEVRGQTDERRFAGYEPQTKDPGEDNIRYTQDEFDWLGEIAALGTQEVFAFAFAVAFAVAF